MAEAKKTAPPAEASDGGQKGKKPVLLYLIIVLLVLVILVGGAVAAWLVLSLSAGQAGGAEPVASEEHEPEKNKEKKEKKDKKKHEEAPVFEKLDTFTVNLQGGTVLQTEIYVRVADEKQKEVIKNFLPLISSNVNLVLSAKKPDELATTDGKLKLMAELKQTINKSLGAKDDEEGVMGVSFKTFIVQ
ncbi:flagellar basal body-associated FliL family protein [Chitinimonas sp.]|uniref:flagellar basal body-associated FliL family protein n=1 Tax=Chitinimonas sp. TaxID=1934313 RepID=UPI0035B1FCDA